MAEPVGEIRYSKNYKNTLPGGGNIGEVIKKRGILDYDVEWDSVTGSGLSETFETVSKNLKNYPYVITYDGDDIDFITYDLGGGDEIIKTFNYTLGVLTSLVLSGDTPYGITLIKTFGFTGEDLTSVVYS
jgi:hypothetical protein